MSGPRLATIDRRTFLASLSLSVLAVPLATEGQLAGAPRIGLISNANPTTGSLQTEAFRRGLRELGWIEGQTVTIEYRWAEGNSDRLPDLIADLVQIKVNVIVLAGTVAIRAAKRATSTIPIVFVSLADPVTLGFVPNLARPGGNMTGLASEFEGLATKQLQLLKEAVPGLGRVAVLANPGNASHALRTKEIADVARALKLQSDVLEASTPREIQEAFAAMAKRRLGAAIVLADPLFFREAHNLVRLAAEQRLPVMYGLREVVVAGGLISYGASFADLFRRAATYVDKILRGASPSDLPVEQASKFELVINLKTAKTLGLTIPQSLLARVDELIR